MRAGLSGYVCLAAGVRAIGPPSPTLPSRLSLGAAIVDFHPQLWPVRYPACAALRVCGWWSCGHCSASDAFQAYTRCSDGGEGPEAEGECQARPAGVLGTLPASRPERIGAPRGGAAKPRRRASAAASAPPKPARRSRARAAPPAAADARAALTDAPPPKPLGAPKGTELVTTTIRAAGELAQIGFTRRRSGAQADDRPASRGRSCVEVADHPVRQRRQTRAPATRPPADGRRASPSRRSDHSGARARRERGADLRGAAHDRRVHRPDRLEDPLAVRVAASPSPTRHAA